ncbi:MAG: CPBP family intramembrane metalloprotease [Gemmatimonadota bacterium]|nr:MAG: CPBP family intramembrane metalloprotease [Gemmatimonadota bacterium]
MRGVVRLAVVLEGGLLILALGIGVLVGVHPLGGARISAGALAWGTVATIPTLLLMWWVSRSTWHPLRRLRREVEHTVVPLFADCSVAELVLIALLAGVAEETLFRGLVQRGIGQAVGPTAGLVVASVIFGAAHFLTHTYALLAAVLGLYLGALLLTTGNLVVPIVVHTLYDIVALLLWVREAGRPEEKPTA